MRDSQSTWIGLPPLDLLFFIVFAVRYGYLACLSLVLAVLLLLRLVRLRRRVVTLFGGASVSPAVVYRAFFPLSFFAFSVVFLYALRSLVAVFVGKTFFVSGLLIEGCLVSESLLVSLVPKSPLQLFLSLFLRLPDLLLQLGLFEQLFEAEQLLGDALVFFEAHAQRIALVEERSSEVGVWMHVSFEQFLLNAFVVEQETSSLAEIEVLHDEQTELLALELVEAVDADIDLFLGQELLHFFLLRGEWQIA